MLEGFASLVGVISNVMYSYLLIIMLLAVGLYFTLRSRFVQLRLLPESIRVVGEKTDSNSVSAFQALMVSTASRVGTGNIVGVANAIAIGGYGAVFWMWLIAIVRRVRRKLWRSVLLYRGGAEEPCAGCYLRDCPDCYLCWRFQYAGVL